VSEENDDAGGKEKHNKSRKQPASRVKKNKSRSVLKDAFDRDDAAEAEAVCIKRKPVSIKPGTKKPAQQATRKQVSAAAPVRASGRKPQPSEAALNSIVNIADNKRLASRSFQEEDEEDEDEDDTEEDDGDE